MTYKLVEKKNPLALHGLFYSLEGAERHLSEVIPVYVKRGYFMDKTLTADCFEIRKCENERERQNPK